MIKKIAENVWKIICNSNIYIIRNGLTAIAIDAGDRQFREEVLRDIKTIMDPKDIKKVYFTHLHYDHIGNVDLFPDAEFYAHKEEIARYKEDPFGTILSDNLFEQFHITLNEFPDDIEFEVIESPGHTVGSVCFLDKERKILFSGDTLFYNNGMGRIDLPTSVPEKMDGTINELDNYDYEMLCPGHDY